MHRVYLGLGSNLGDRHQHLEQAISLINERVGEVIRRSSFIETEPWGFESGNTFLNGVILCETTLAPREVLKATQQIELELGRRKSLNRTREALGSSKKSVNRKYEDRPIDIDILLYDDLTIDEPDLKIPHPLMHQRDFVMIPLNEIKTN
jgi:2-amino-4-hydroxy-6-hydroxymethyldihydropteridine diphosphokinase